MTTGERHVLDGRTRARTSSSHRRRTTSERLSTFPRFSSIKIPVEAGQLAPRIRRRATFLCLAAWLSTIATVSSAGAETPSDLTPQQVQAQQWWIGRLGLTDVWKKSQGSGTVVAVIDTGVDASFGDLRGAVLPGFGVGTSSDGRHDTDPEVHGTRMADTIAGRGTGFGLLGVARKARILPIAAPELSDRATAEALTRLTAMAHPPDVVNMSYGAGGECSADLQRAVQAATSSGMILVASAGNQGSTTNQTQHPANCVGVVAVGAFGQDLQPWVDSQRQPYVSLSGPGVKLIGYDTSASSRYGYGYGTSDAAAIVSATMAVVKARFPRATPREIVARVLYTAKQFQGAQGTRNNTWGYGVARPYDAIYESVPKNAPNPIYDALDRLGSGGTPSPRPARITPPAVTPSSDDKGRDDSSATLSVAAIIVSVSLAGILVGTLVYLQRRKRPHQQEARHGSPPGPE